MKLTNQYPIKAGWLVAAAMTLQVASLAANREYPGFIKVENFDAITGGNIANLTSSGKYQTNNPDSITFINTMNWDRPGDINDFGSRVSGVLTPTETATYVFFMASDDSSSFYLSTDATPANLKLIAADQGWQNQREWTGPGGTSSGGGTTTAVFRRGYNPGPTVMAANGFLWVGPFQNRSDEFLNSPLTNLVAGNAWPTTDVNGNAVINLVANQKYYFEILFKEGTGGDYTAVAWKKAGDPDPANGDPIEIVGTDSATFTNLTVTWTDVLTIRRQPQSLTVQEGQTANFTAEVVGVPGDSDPTLWTYQWYSNNIAIADGSGNAAIYTIPTPTVGMSGSKYKLEITTPGSSIVGVLTATTAEATLTVINDVLAPSISQIRTSDTFDSAKITFSEAVRDEAVNPLNYSITGGLTVTDVNFSIVVTPDDPKSPVNPANRQAVVLITSLQTEGATYTVTINNVKDMIGNNLTPNTRAMYANVFRAGVLNYKRWMGGNNIPALVGDPLRFADPTFVETRTVAATGGDQDTYVPGTYVDRVDGYFIPNVTSNYVFFLSSDNDGHLYLSTDASPANRKLIAADIGWQNSRTWTGAGGDDAKRRGDGVGGGPFENRSDELLTTTRAASGTGLPTGLPLVPSDAIDPEPWPMTNVTGNAVITLTNGNRHAFQFWHMEGDSGRAEVTFKFGGAPDPANGSASTIRGEFIGAFVDPSSLPPLLSINGATITFTGRLLSSSTADGSYLPVVGATSPYTVPTPKVGNNFYRAVFP